MIMLVVNFEQILHLFLVFLLLNLNKYKLGGLFQCFPVFYSKCSRTMEDIEINKNIGMKSVYKFRARYHLKIIGLRSEIRRKLLRQLQRHSTSFTAFIMYANLSGTS